MIIDYSRRTDPACKAGLALFREKIKNLKRYDNDIQVIHFWTKAPAVLAELYERDIKELQSRGVIVCAQVTINNYDAPLERVTPEMRDIKPLVKLIGSKAIRLRFDPIIYGYTTEGHFKKTLNSAIENDISRITINFLEPKYQGVGRLLRENNINVGFGDITRQKADILTTIRWTTPKNIEIAVCAESEYLRKYSPDIQKAACSDPEWFKQLGFSSPKNTHFTRKDCGCFYTKDWGKYPSQGGYVCPHKCLYCYAKHNIYQELPI